MAASDLSSPDPTAAELAHALAELRAEVALLRSEADIRRLVGRYMFLCDAPLPEPENAALPRHEAIATLFTEDAIWEGVGSAHGAQFGRKQGRGEIAAHFADFFGGTPRQVFNTHYLCSEQIIPASDTAEGRWVQMQPWIFADGSTLVRSSRLQIRFRRTGEGWRISHYRTENLFVAPLPENWAPTLIERSNLIGDG